MKSGFVAIIGMPNAGKSSILNCFIGEKVSIVTPKPQTTRSRIRGIYNSPDYQIIFTDTPGFINRQTKLAEFMASEIVSAQNENDIILLVIDSIKGIRPADIEQIERYQGSDNFLVALNKTDKLSGGDVLQLIDQIKDYKIAEIVPVSAATGHNIPLLLDLIKKRLTDTVLYYDTGMYTDKPMSFIAAEIIREKLLLTLEQEVPHGIAVEIEEYVVEPDLIKISALIVCEKQSHKSIVIGKGGRVLKEIGSRAREELEHLTGSKVFLQTYVKVVPDWRNNPARLRDLGFKST